LEDALAVSNLRCYQCSLKGLAANTVRAAFHPLRGLSEFLIHEAKLLEENPVKAFTMPKKAEGRRLTMSDPEALALLDAAARQCDPRKVAMSVALISALLYTGVRADELVNIRLADVLFDQEEMLVSKGKGGKKRTLFPTPDFFVAVRAWQHERNGMGCEHDCQLAQGAVGGGNLARQFPGRCQGRRQWCRVEGPVVLRDFDDLALFVFAEVGWLHVWTCLLYLGVIRR